MEEFTVALALEDYVTVIFFAIGLYFLWQMSRQTTMTAARLVGLGGLLITLGGFSKATWKLIVAATGSDIWLMDNAQFILMAPGYILLAAGILMALRHLKGNQASQNLTWPLLLISLTLAGAAILSQLAEGRAWFFLLLGVTTVMNVVLSGALVRYSLAEGLRAAAGLFTLNIVLVFVLAGMAGSFERTLALQWIEQITNNISFGAFAIAGWMTRNHVMRS